MNPITELLQEAEVRLEVLIAEKVSKKYLDKAEQELEKLRELYSRLELSEQNSTLL